ncbi:unnamed protein product [Camellia sinensis]
MEVAMEVEDDVFFADLNKQISLLIMDDDDGDDPVAHCPSVSLQGFSRAVYPAAQAQAQAQPPPPPFSYQQTCRRESKGTGVFIPQSSHPRRKNRQGKNSSSNNTKFQRHSDNSSGPPHASFMNIPSQNSINPKRC